MWAWPLWYNCYTFEVRFKYDRRKSQVLRANPKRGIGFEEAQELWTHPYYEDHRSDNPEQFRAIGWARGMLISIIFEIRDDEEGEYYHLVTLWRSTKQEEKLYEQNT